MRTFIFLFIGIGCVVSSWIILGTLVQNKESDESQNNSTTLSTRETESSADGQQGITTWGGNKLSAEKYIEHPDTTEILENEFYSNSNDPDLYTIYYDVPSGNITILLLKQPLSLARQLAERQLSDLIQVPKDSLCNYEIRVLVNEAVDEAFSLYGNLGLSFCPGAVQLP
jgi:hypothetical protein